MKDTLYLYQLECCKYLVEHNLQRRYGIYFTSSTDFSWDNVVGFVIQQTYVLPVSVSDYGNIFNTKLLKRNSECIFIDDSNIFIWMLRIL